MNPVLTSEMDLNLQQPKAKLWRVWGLIIIAEFIGHAATSVGMHLCPDRSSEVTVEPGRWSYKYRD